MLDIHIKVIPHAQQRYPTAGDWRINGDEILISVSSTGDWRANAVIAVHELVEAILCKNSRIPQAEVDAFDIAYEKSRPEGDLSEPGDNPMSPYHRPHCFATAVERMLVAAMWMNWAEYEQAVEAL